MSPLELKRMKLELINVSAARHGLEFKIEERLEDIKRIEEQIKLQLAKEEDLKVRIAAAETAE